MTGRGTDRPDVAREEDRIARLVARAGATAGELRAELPLDSPAGAAYADWLAREARLGASAMERRRDVRAARDLAARVLARRGVERALEGGLVPRPHESLVERPAPRALPTAAAVTEASRVRCAPWMELSVAAGAGRELWEQECDRWVELPQGLPSGRYLALGVSGDSMEPLLAAGDTVLVRVDAPAVAGGVVVARLGDDGYVVKQVGRITARTIELRSLNPAYAPVRMKHATGAVLGAVVMVWSGRTR